jgi:hypothetical protein
VPSFTFNFERNVPVLPWRRVGLVAAAIALAATVGWEIHVRSLGYRPTLNDTTDLWAQQRGAVRPESIVIIGDSRALFDLDLDVLQREFGQRPIQLALAGSCAYPVLADLAADEKFHGAVICSVVPGMFFAPGGPLLETSEKALKRYHTWTPAQRISHQLGIRLEEWVAFLKDDELNLGALLGWVQIPNRPNAHLPPDFPPYFQTVDRDRRARMTETCAQPGILQTRVKEGWLPLFTPPPPPNYVPREIFLEGVGKKIEARFQDTAAAVEKIRARGGKVVFVRFPFTGKLKEHEDRTQPRAGAWTRLLNDTKAPGIYFEDFPELASFDCPEWSHLNADDSVEFTRRLVPHLRAALGN